MSKAKVLYCTRCDKFYTFAEQHIPESSVLAGLVERKDFRVLCWAINCDGAVRFALPQLGFDFWREA